MKKILFLFSTILCLLTYAQAQETFETPGNGTTYTLDLLVTESGGALISAGSGVYHQMADIEITAPDKLEILINGALKGAANTRLFCYGKLTINPSEEFVVTSISEEIDNYGYGIHLATEESSVVRNTIFEKTGGLRFSGCEDVLVENCKFRYNKYSGQMSSAIVVTNSKPHIKDCEFTYNQRSAISSAANTSAAPFIENCLFYANNTANQNTPQINLGPGFANDTAKIIGCHIEGAAPGWAMGGGIGISCMIAGTATAIIDGNTIIENRYGITGTGNGVTLIVTNNFIDHNNHEANPNNGGSGLNFYCTNSTTKMFASNNVISNNLWGMTAIGPGQANFGNLSGTATDYGVDAYNIGQNVFRNNGNENTPQSHFANNGIADQKAENNDWGVYTAEEIEAWLMHEGSYGTIDYEPFIVPGPYVTAGTGRTFTLDDLAACSFGALAKEEEGLYHLNYNVTITAPDKFEVLTDGVLKQEKNTRLFCYGKMTINPSEEFVVTSISDDAANYGYGIHVETQETCLVKNTVFEKTGGLRISGCNDILVENCQFLNNKYSTQMSSPIVVTNAKPYIKDCEFKFNQRSAISSASNSSVAPIIEDCLFYGNNVENRNYPQINFGPGIAGDTTKIIGCHIEGAEAGWAMAGGIAFSTLVGGTSNVLIDGNTIIHNRYGITATGNNITMIVTNNLIDHNNHEANPNNGGSGINITNNATTSNTKIFASNNVVSNNLWGVTVIGPPTANFGNLSGTATDHSVDAYNIGQNVFRNNGNVNMPQCHFGNNGTSDQKAENNDWDVYTSEEIETWLMHGGDYGTIDYEPFMLLTPATCDAPTNLQAEAWEWMPRTSLTWELEGAKKASLPRVSSAIVAASSKTATNKEMTEPLIHDRVSDEISENSSTYYEESFQPVTPMRDGATLFDQAVFVTHPGEGAGGLDVSAVHSGLSTLGNNVSNASGYWIADDFTVFSDFTISEMDFFVYQTGSGNTPTITDIFIEIWDKSPLEGGECIFATGDNMLIASEFTNCYRINSTDYANTDRPIMKVTAGFEDASFPAGTYWVAASFLGSVASGPWAVPITVLGQRHTGNALMYSATKWYAWRDGNGPQGGLPLVVRGTAETTNIEGFNIYRNDVLVNQSPIVGFEYVDLTLDYETEYCYTVKTVFNDECGLSEASNSACVTTMEPMPDCNQVGTPTHVTYILPMNTYFKHSYTQQLYLADELELDPDFSIEQISFAYYYNRLMPKDNITIYIGATSKSAFSGTSDWIPVSEMTEVFSGDIIFDTVNEDDDLWFPIVLDTPFAYDGTSNIVVAVLNNSGTDVSGNASTFRIEEGNAGKTMYAYRDSAPYDVEDLPNASSSTFGYRSIMKFCGAVEVSYCPPVTDLAVNFDNNCAAILTWTAPEGVANATYKIFRENVLIASNISTTTYTDSNFDFSVSHQWCVVAVNEENVESEHVPVSGICPLTLYTITASASIGGSISPSGTVTVISGNNQTFTFTPNSGYALSNVLVDGVDNPTAVSNGYYTFANVTASHTIAAVFESTGTVLTITATSGEGGIIVPEGITTVPYGGSQFYTFTPNTGYKVSQVLIDGVYNATATENQMYLFSNVVMSHTIHVDFELKTYVVTASATTGGTIAPSGAIQVTHGGSQTFTFAANENYELTQVLIDGVNNEAAVAAGSYTFANVTAAHGIQAVFAIKTYEITATAGDGGRISPEGTASVVHGGNKTYKIIPNTGFKIAQVLIDGENNAAAVESGSYTFENIIAAHTIEAEFTPITFIITVKYYVSGDLTSQGGEFEIGWGETPTFTFQPDAGYQIVDVTVDGESKPAAVHTAFYTFPPVMDDHELIIYFDLRSYVITAVATGAGTIDPAGEVEVIHGSNQTFTFTPDEGYQIKRLVVDHLLVEIADSYTFENVAEKHRIEVEFEIKTGIDNIETSSLTIYPNPTSGELKIRNEEVGIRNIRIFDMTGRLIQEAQNVNNIEFVLDISGFVSGIYFIDVDGKTMKIIKR